MLTVLIKYVKYMIYLYVKPGMNSRSIFSTYSDDRETFDFIYRIPTTGPTVDSWKKSYIVKVCNSEALLYSGLRYWVLTGLNIGSFTS